MYALRLLHTHNAPCRMQCRVDGIVSIERHKFTLSYEMVSAICDVVKLKSVANVSAKKSRQEEATSNIAWGGFTPMTSSGKRSE